MSGAGSRLLAAVAMLGLALPAGCQVASTTPSQAGGGAQWNTPPGTTWVFGASSLRLAGAIPLDPPPERLNETADVVLPALPAGARLVFVNFALSSEAAGGAVTPREMKPGNANTIDFATLFTGANGGGTAIPLRFAGATGTSMADGGFAVSDPIATPFAGGIVRTSITTPAGGSRPRGFTSASMLNEKRVNAAAANGAWAAGGALSGLAANTSNGYRPAAVLVPWDGKPSVLLIGDSITQQEDDSRYFAGPRGVIGGIARGLDDTNGGRFNFVNFGHHGAKMADFEDITPSAGYFGLRYAMLKSIRDGINRGQAWPMTILWSQGLRNDFNGGTLKVSASTPLPAALAAMQKRANSWWSFLKATFPGLPIVQSTITPKTIDSSTYRTTLAAQAASSPAVDGPALQAFNDWLASRPAPLALAVDLRGAVQAPDDGSGIPKWALTPVAQAGGGTLAAAVPAGLNYSSTGVTMTAAAAPQPGSFLVLEPGTANVEAPGSQILSVTANGPGSYTVKLASSSTAARTHGAGSGVSTSYVLDGTHPGSALHMLTATPVIAAKAKLPFLKPR